MNKLRKFIAENNFRSIDFMQNNCFMYEGTAVCGTRGWIHPAWDGFSSEDKRIFEREVIRAELSLKEAEQCEDIIFCSHYPVCSNELEKNAMTELLKKYNVKEVVYGHIHGNARRFAVEGKHGEIRYRLVSADCVRFVPQLLR